MGNIRRRKIAIDGSEWWSYRYTHDAWNRLVRVQHVTDPGGTETVVDVHETQYNGLDWRIVKRCDTTVPINGLDQERRMYYSGGGERLLEERIDEDYSGSPGMNRHMAYIWGLRYIDDIVCRLVDGNVDGDYLDYAAGTDKIYYHLTDDEFSTVCIVDHTAKVLERVSYDAYGNPRHHRRSDLNGEGSTNIDDQLIVINNWGAPGKGDLDRDGAADIDDLLAVSNDWGAAAPRGRLNYFDNFGTDNTLGANGMMYNQELSGTPGGGGVNGGAAGGGGGTYGGRGGGNFDSTTGRSSSRAGNPRGAMAMAAGLNGMMGDMGLGSMGISPGTGMCPKSNDSENSPIGDGGPRGRPGPGGDGGEGGGPGPGPGVGPGGGRGPRGGGRTPGWAWGAHDIDPETGKLIAPMEPMPQVRSPGDPGYDEIFALNASWWTRGSERPSWWTTELWGGAKGFVRELGHQLWEKKWEILLTVATGGVGRLLGTAGRCFLVVACFAAGTEVWASEFSTDIENVRSGDLVWSWDEQTGEVGLREVLTTFSTPDQPVYELVIEHADGSCETIEGTAEHPFYVEGRGWTALEDLARDDALIELSRGPRTETDRYQDARVWEVRATGRTETVYNLVVDSTHTYYVGDDGVLVHNECRAHQVYAINRAAGGSVFKIGMSSTELGARAGSQARALTRATGAVHEYRILGTYGTRAEALAAERAAVERWTRWFPNSLPGNIYLRW